MERDTRADNLDGRLIQFSIDIVKLAGDLPQNFQTRHIAGQLLRSGTAAAPNYGEARAAESRVRTFAWGMLPLLAAEQTPASARVGIN